MNERIKELAQQSGLEWVEMMKTWLANDAEIERFYEMAFEAGRMVGFKQDKALTELARIGQEIEQAEKQEPVAWVYINEDGECEQIECGTEGCDDPDVQPLYTAPPRKEWVGLTDDEVSKVYCDWLEYIKINNDDNLRIFVLQIEAKLKGKNT